MPTADLGELGTWAGWAVVVASALTLASQAARWSPTRTIGILQSMNVPLTIALAVVALVAAFTDRAALGLTASIVGLLSWTSVLRAVRPRIGVPTRHDASPTIRVASANLLYTNARPLDAADALAAIDADVVYVTEYTPEFGSLLECHPVRAPYPHRVEDPRVKGSGSALWSRLPLLAVDAPDADRDTVVVVVDSPVGPLTIIAVHPHTPVESARLWRRGLRLIAAQAAAASGPLLVVGDFNAAYWHPLFDDLRNDGLLDEHVEHGRGLSASWPTHRPVPKWLRLDHALTGNGLRARAVQDFDVPGSDHAGLVVEVTTVGGKPTAPTSP